jgi:hypothetical protein
MKTIIMTAALFFAGISITDAQTKTKTTHHKAKHKTHKTMTNMSDSTAHKSGPMKTKTTTKKK